jgi:hypothetical protein
MSRPQTVRVRIAVAVDCFGTWSSAGWGCEAKRIPDELKMEVAVEDLTDGEARYWLEAELALPEALPVQAEVTEAK